MTYYQPPRNPCLVSEYELIYEFRCPQGHTWAAASLDVGPDEDGDGCECPTCQEWFSEIVNVKEQPI